jgi:type VI secretion system lysozyme-like protein
MPSSNEYQFEFTPSIIDRLTVSQTNQAGSPREGSKEALEIAIQRDLACLLNTRRERDPVPHGYPEALASLLMFGVPDVTMTNLRLASEQNQLRSAIETAVRIFEPRLSDVKVIVEHWDEAKPTLRFRIEAFLSDEPVGFDTVLQSDNGEFLIRRRS